jgi:hypothetical protein
LRQINICDIESNTFEINGDYDDVVDLEVNKNQGYVVLADQSAAYDYFTRTDPNRCGVETVQFRFANDSEVTDDTRLWDQLNLGSVTDDSITFDSDVPQTDGFISNNFYDFTYEITTAGGNVLSKDVNVRVIICQDEEITLVNSTDKEYELWLDQPTAETI